MRFKTITKPLPSPPQQCIVTGRADGEIIDFGVDVQFLNPHIYIKKSIVEEAAAKECEMLSAADALELTNRITELEYEVAHPDPTKFPPQALLDALGTQLAAE